jgi:hypothetical protein
MILVDNVLVNVEEPTDEQWESGVIAILTIETPAYTSVTINCVEVDDKLTLEYTGGQWDSWIKDTLHDTILDYMYDITEETDDEELQEEE